jgi:hypothetical protein
MTLLAAVLLSSILPAGQDGTAPDQRSIDRWVSDLGAQDPQVRDRAEAELRKRGGDAVPALREAARSDNAERAMRARALLLDLSKDHRGNDHSSQGRSPAPRMAILYEDWTQGIRFSMNPDGTVQFTAPEKDDQTERREYRTYRASSMDDFKKKYPQVVEKYELDKLVSVREAPGGDDALRQWLGLGEPPEGKDESEGRRFGILIAPVPPALAAHLALPEGEGLLVRQVEAGSLAQKSEVKRFDVILALNGQKAHVQNVEEFRKSLQEALGTEKFSLELIRGGKRETIQVKPTLEKEEKKEKAK